MRILADDFKGGIRLFLAAAILLVLQMSDAIAGGFFGRDPIAVEISADKTTLPVNINNVGPQIGGPYTNTITVTAKKNGNVISTPINIAISSGLASGALFYLDGDPAHERCPAGSTCPPVPTEPIAFRQIAFDDATGIATFHFHASNVPGTVVITASAADPITGQVLSASLTITVTGGGGSSGGKPSAVTILMDPGPIYIRTNPAGTAVGQSSVKLFQVFVGDDFGQFIPQSDGNPLRIELLPNRPNGGEWLSATDAKGNAQEGPSVVSGLFGGAATVSLHGGTLPGTVVIAATADRADNNVDNGIQMGITSYATVSIGTGQISSLTFTGPFADAVFAKSNNLVAIDGQCGAQACDSIWNGVYSRVLSVIASDAFGNPPPEGTPISFRLIDSPLDMLKNRYPDQGHGEFAITGYTGDPQEGGLEFFAPNRTVKRTASDTLNPFVVPNGVSFALADPLCLLMLQDPEIINSNPSTINGLPSEGRREYHGGSRIITGRAGNMLLVNSPFKQVSQNVGANVWYTVGCPPYKGNISPSGTAEVTAVTNASGVASTVMNYPASQVGRRFMVSAESDGGQVGAVLTHWYLGNPDGSIVTIAQPPQLSSQIDPTVTTGIVSVVQTIDPGAALNLPVTLKVLDGGITSGGALRRTPIPGVSLAVDVVIKDPSEAKAILAEETLAKAQASFDAFVAANPGVCDLVVTDPANPTPAPRDAEKCTKQKELATALDTAKTAAVEARLVANLHTPTASVTPKTVVSGAGGLARVVLEVSDLPADGSVDFFFSSVGPEILTQTLQITVKPEQAAPPTP
ncbi:MAG: hypothetical protein IPL51_03735 [Candidatus Competibacteraceae bacterium]|nr:hypothetical protein [Candidatus Competibacteraceae bacterium]